MCRYALQIHHTGEKRQLECVARFFAEHIGQLVPECVLHAVCIDHNDRYLIERRSFLDNIKQGMFLFPFSTFAFAFVEWNMRRYCSLSRQSASYTAMIFSMPLEYMVSGYLRWYRSILGCGMYPVGSHARPNRETLRSSFRTEKERGSVNHLLAVRRQCREASASSIVVRKI